MQLKCLNTNMVILDFDGVLFHSHLEVYNVCQSLAEKHSDLRQDVTLRQFLDFRTYLTNAWQFRLLYSNERDLKGWDDLSSVVPDQRDWEFSRNFFSERQELMSSNEWLEGFKPFNIFEMVLPLMNDHPNNIVILSTRNAQSIDKVFRHYGLVFKNIYGQEIFEKYGSKFEASKNLSWLNGERRPICVDDILEHLLPFKGYANCLHADWGYGRSDEHSLSQDEVFLTIKSHLQIK